MSLPHYAIRAGVSFPDWTAVTSLRAREALLAIFEVLDLDRMWRNYTPAQDGVRTTLLRLYAELGRAPPIRGLAEQAGVSETAIASILASLEARDLLVLDADGKGINGAYPFTDRDTEHRVRLGDRTLNAMCAIDALGVAAMYARDVEIGSRCRFCAAPVRITTRDCGCALDDVEPATMLVWSGLRYEDGCAANSICRTIAFFCSDAHLETWRATHDAKAPGFRLSIDEALEAGRAIFGPTLGAVHAHQ